LCEGPRSTTDYIELAREFDTLLAAASPWEGVAVEDTEIAELLYTSGTVSAPKGCLHSHRGIHAVAAYTTATMGLRRTDRFLISMPIWHASPLNNWFLSMMFVGGTVVLQREYHPLEFPPHGRRAAGDGILRRPHRLSCPAAGATAAGVDLADFDLSSVRAWIYGAAPLGAQTVRRLQQAYGSDAFYQVYGMTESCGYSHVCRPGQQTIGWIGLPCPGVEVRIDPLGEVQVRSGATMLGYFKDPEKTAETLTPDGFLRTGDKGEQDAEGRLRLTGRLKEIFKTSKGKYVAPAPIENRLAEHARIEQVCVVGDGLPAPMGLCVLSAAARRMRASLARQP